MSSVNWNVVCEDLVSYGIQNENSHIRIHVCVDAKRVYVYPTECGLKAIERGDYRKVNAYQPGHDEHTGEGYLVPPHDIEKCVELNIRDKAWDFFGFCREDSTTEKGDKAVRLVRAMLKEGLVPLPTQSREIKDKDLQIEGTDILVKSNNIHHEDIKIQVKCDYPGGRKELGGTGNLFLQTAESNPFKLY